MPKLYEAGKIVNTHGIRGEMRVLPWANSPDFLTQFHTLYLNGSPYKAKIRTRNTCVLVRLEGIDTVEAARSLVGQLLWIDGEDARLEDGAVFVQELLGMTAVADGVPVGKVTDVLSMPKHDVYEITGEKTYLVPAVREFIHGIDREKRQVQITLLEGMEEDAD